MSGAEEYSFAPSQTLVTGGEGLLARELCLAEPRLACPPRQLFDVTEYAQMEAYVSSQDLTCIVHAAAFTSPPKINEHPLTAMEVNIVGTANVVRLCMKHGYRLVYISTDYVFKGDVGNYREDDPVLPANKYAWSKLGGECAVQLYDNALIIRTTFGPNSFPFPKAFVDQWTSRESVSITARLILRALQRDVRGILHVGGPRKTVYEYGKSLDPTKEIGELRTTEVTFSVPRDTSLNTDKYLAEIGPFDLRVQQQSGNV